MSSTEADVSWANVTPVSVGRDGVDSTGYGAWDTSVGGRGLLAAETAAKTMRFKALVPGRSYTYTLTQAGGAKLTFTLKQPATNATTTTTAVCPPVTTTTTSTTAAPATSPTFTATAVSSTQTDVKWNNVTPTSVGRNGVDSTGYGAWDTSVGGRGLLASEVTAKTLRFTSLVPGATYTYTLTRATGANLTVTLKQPGTTTTSTTTAPKPTTTTTVPAPTPPVPTPPTPASGNLKMGLYSGNSAGGITSYENLIGGSSEVEVLSTYWDTRDASFNGDMFGAGGVNAWLDADPGHWLLFGVNPLVGEPGNWYSSALDSQMRHMAQTLSATGNANQIIIRFGYEMNGDWMPWSPRNNGGSNQGFKDMWRRQFSIVEGVNTGFRWDYSVVPWAGNQAELEATWPGNDVVDIVGMDVYPAYGSGWNDFLARYNTGMAFARAHGKAMSIDEQAQWAPSVGTGDDPTFITNSLNLLDANDFQWRIYFNVPDGGVNCTLTCYPRGLEAERAFWR